MKVAVYARYSSNNQREESITAQLRAAKAYCYNKGYSIINEYCDEAFSGTNDHRPAFQKLIKDAKSGMFSAVIFHKIDRNARNEYDYYYNKAQLEKYGVHYEYVTQNIDDSPEGQMMETVMVGMAAYYSRNLAKEALKGQRENAYKARHNGGTPPLGYDVGPDLKYIINEKEAPIVRLIFKLRADGFGYNQILTELNQNGYRTKRGIPFGKNSLYDILRNKKYMGIYTFGRVSGGKLHKRNNHMGASKDIIEIPGGMPAIISQEIWNKVHERMMADRHTPGKYKAKTSYYLTGKVYCAKCGSHMVGGVFTSKGFKYSYYSCANNNKTICGCKGTRIKKEWLEGATLNYIDMQLLNPELVPLLTKEIKNRLSSVSTSYKTEKMSIEQQHNEITGKINHLLDLAEDGNTGDLIKTRLIENKNRLTSLEKRMTQLKNTNINFVPTEEQVAKLIESYSKKNKKPEDIRNLIETFVERITVSKEYIIIKLRFAYEWWRRGESNSCPKTLPHKFLRVHFVFVF